MILANKQMMYECIWPAKAILGEAPYWCVEEQVLYWVDIDGKAVMRYNPKSGARDIFPQRYEIGNIVKRANGGFISSLEAGLAIYDPELISLEIFAEPEKIWPNNRFNDGKCDRQGRFWTGSLDRGEELPAGSLYCIYARDSISVVMSDLIVPNGMGWSPDGGTMYFTDSGRGTIYAYDFDPQTGSIENCRDFVVVDSLYGVPDGLCVDAEGFVWSAHWDGGRISRYDPDGIVERIIEMPVPQVTSLAFGGENLDQLYVTSARHNLSQTQLADAPLSGGLFMLYPDVKGLPEVPFKD
jgi:sugar lactone lactonase YvrE